MNNHFITICIVHRNKKNLQLLHQLLHNKEGCACVGIFLSGEDALLKIPKLSPAVVILDINLPGINGIDCIKQLKHLCKNTQFMIYTACDDNATVLAAFKAGAASYILHNSPLQELAGHIKELHNGGSPVSNSIARKLILSLQQPEINNQGKYAITKREKEILLLLDKGGSYNIIADTLFISSKTVRKHIYNIYGKLRASNKIEAVNRFFGRS